jgi:hypothetical protein
MVSAGVRRMVTLGSGGAVLGLLCLAVLAPAGASGAKIGSDLKGAAEPNAGYSCGSLTPVCAIQQTVLPGRRSKAPFSGWIVKWRFRNIVDPLVPVPVRLRVVRDLGGDEYRFVRSSKRRRIHKEGKHRYRTELRIRKGDYIALEMDTGSENEGIYGFYASSTGARALEWFGTPGDGQTGNPDDTSEGVEFFYNATVKRRRPD